MAKTVEGGVYERMIDAADREIWRMGIEKCGGNLEQLAGWFQVSIVMINKRVKKYGFDDLVTFRPDPFGDKRGSGFRNKEA